MKTSDSESAFTVIEVLVVICIMAVFLAMLFPARSRKPTKATTTACLSNQKQVALGLILFSADNAGKFPWQIATTNGGSMELIAGNQAFPHYRAISKYFDGRTQCLVCPTDTARHATNNFSQILDDNLSYFLNLEAQSAASFILSGDRHLAAGGKEVGLGSFIYSTNMALSWTRELHARNGPIGVLSFADGHAQVARSDELNPIFQHQLLATDRFIVP